MSQSRMTTQRKAAHHGARGPPSLLSVNAENLASEFVPSINVKVPFVNCGGKRLSGKKVSTALYCAHSLPLKLANFALTVKQEISFVNISAYTLKTNLRFPMRIC